jgi:molybdopterin synthase sulfur carrier subunit
MQHQVWIPALHRDLTGGVEVVEVSGDSVAAVIASLETSYPGIEARLCENGRIRPYISVAVNSEITRRGLRQKLREPSEIHFVPSLGGGAGYTV